ncbi:MAG: pseudouridine synthase [bacterium]|nr:pseudouridine synthase [bacterium]
MDRYFIVYKPYKMLSQFVSPYEHRLLGHLAFDFPEGTHAVGRLDDESEGLLILTTDKSLTRKLMHPSKKHKRHYLVLVEKEVEDSTLERLRNGIKILVKKKGTYTTLPCEVNRIYTTGAIPAREPAFVEYEPHTWLEFVLTEGKNRQLRKMCKAVRHTCKRLIRTRIENLNLDGMTAGEVKEIEKDRLFSLLGLAI